MPATSNATCPNDNDFGFRSIATSIAPQPEG